MSAARRRPRVLARDVILDVGASLKVSLFSAASILMLVAFGGLGLSPCYETMSLQIGPAGRDRFLIPFEANARNIGNVKQSVTNFIWLL